jgi:hypothetical protein
MRLKTNIQHVIVCFELENECKIFNHASLFVLVTKLHYFSLKSSALCAEKQIFVSVKIAIYFYVSVELAATIR